MKNSILKAFINFSFWTAISRVFGLLRDVFLAASLGAGLVSDAFFVAFKLPNMFRRLVAEGALVQSFLPTFSYVEENNSKQQAQEFASYVQSIILIVLLATLIIAEIFMSYLIIGLAPGFIKNKEVLETATSFARATIIYLPMLSVIAIWGSILQYSGKFMPSAASPIILNVSLISASLLFLSGQFTHDIIAFSVPIAGVLQLLFLVLWLHKLRRIPKIIIPNKNYKTYGVWKKFFPASLGAGVIQINLLVDTILASIVGTSAVSYLYYADRLSQLPLGIIGIAMGTALLPNLSKAETNNKISLIKESVEKYLTFGFIFSIPSCVAFFIIPEMLIEVIYARGAFDDKDVNNVSIALLAYGLGVPAFISIKVLQAPFFAMRDTVTPFRISIFSVLVNILLSIILMKYLGFFGIALATSISSYLTSTCYFLILLKKGRVSTNVLRSLSIIILLGLCFGLILFGLSSTFANLNLILSVTLIIVISVIIWFSAMVFFKFIKINSIKDIFKI